MSKWKYWISGVFAILCLTEIAAELAVISALSILGFPLTVFIIVFPAAYLVFLIVRILKYRTKLSLRKRIFITLLLLGLPPLAINTIYDVKHAAYLRHDIDLTARPIEIASLAVIADGYTSSEKCNGFCQRALLNGVVDKVIMVGKKHPHEIKNFSDILGKAYWFEERDTCPPPEIGNSNNFSSGKKDINLENLSSDDLVKIRSRQKTCLVSDDASITKANGVIAIGYLKHARGNITSRLNPFVDTASAHRLAFYNRNSDRFEMIYQNTNVRSKPLYPILVPALAPAGGLNFRPGFWRSTKYHGDENIHGVGVSYSNFVQEKLGLDLVLDGSKFGNVRIEILKYYANTDKKLNSAETNFVEDFFGNGNWHGKLSKEEAELGVKILQNPKIEVPRQANIAISGINKAFPEMSEPLSEALFTKLKTFKPNQKMKFISGQYRQLKLITSALNALPAGVTENYFSLMKQLADDPVARIYSDRLLARFSEHGHKGAEQLIYLIEDSSRFKDNRKAIDDQWAHPTLAGLVGLCRMGRSGFKSEKIVDRLLGLSRSIPGLVSEPSFGTQIVKTLFALGASSERIISHLEKLSMSDKKLNKAVRDQLITGLDRTKNEINCSDWQ